MIARILSLATVACGLVWAASPHAAGRQSTPTPITVFAAADLGPPFKLLVPRFEQVAGATVTLVLGSTGTLAQQIRNGAPADLFFAADETYVQQLAAERLTLGHTSQLYARGRIATITLRSEGFQIGDLRDLGRPEIKRIAIANPRHAPYGRAAKQALDTAGLWKSVETRLVYGENVQQAAQFVLSGSADAGIVARSVADSPELRWTLIDDALHDPLDQMAVVLSRAKQPSASKAFIEFVIGNQGRTVMRRFGFLLPGEPL